jgi:hypothetical protein
MKRISLLMMIAVVVVTTMAFSQSKNKSVEVLYFKARQCACKTRACNALENQVRSIIDQDFPDKNIEFKQVWLDDKKSAAIIEKYHATGQTVVMVRTKRKKEWSTDLTEPVKNLTVTGKSATAKAELKKLIDENL